MVKVVQALFGLGVAIDGTGSTVAAMEHRCTAASRQFQLRRPQLLNGRVPLGPRLERHADTCEASLLWGAGGWSYTLARGKALKQWQLRHSRRLLLRRKRPQQTRKEWFVRTADCLRMR